MAYRITNINYNKRAIAPIFAIIVIAVVAIVAFAAISQIHWPDSSPIKVQSFEVQPSKFSVKDSGTLTVKLQNSLSTDNTNVLIKFETSDNVQIYQGNTILPKESGFYVFNKQLSASEVSELRFGIQGTIDVGDNSRDYYVEAHCYVGGNCYATPSASFTITR